MRSFFNFLRSNKLYTAINIFGLCMSMSFVILLGIYVSNQIKTDSFHVNRDRIYLIANDIGKASAYHLQDYLPKRFPEIEKTTAFGSEPNVEFSFEGGEEIFASLGMADSTFFDIFSFEIVAGAAADFSNIKNSLIISEQFASTYFGDTEPLGKTLYYKSVKELPFVVTGIMKNIDNSVIPYCDVIMRAEWMERFNPSHNIHLGNSAGVQTFVLTNGVSDFKSRKSEVLEYFKEFWWIYQGAGAEDLIVLPLKEVFFCGEDLLLLNSGDRSMVELLAAVCLVLLIFAILNYVNLTTALSGFRAKEMATRRLSGASGARVFAKMIGESTLLCAIATLVSVFIAEALAPAASELLEYEFSVINELSLGRMLVIVSFVVLTGLIAGLAPALILLKVQPIDIVRGSFRTKTKTTYSKVVIVIQSTITLIMIAMSLTMMSQVNHMITAPLGYNTKNIINIKNNNFGAAEELNIAKEKLKSLSCVNNVGYGKGLPLNGTNNETILLSNGDWLSFQQIYGDEGYFNILGLKPKQDFNNPQYWWLNEYGAKLVAQAFGDGRDESSLNYIPIEGSGDNWKIGGIYYDFKFWSLLMEQSAALIFNVKNYPVKDWPWNIIVEVNGNKADAYKQVEAVFKEVFPGKLFEADYVENQISDTFHKEKVTMIIIMIFAFLSLIVSSLGLLAMSTYYLLQERKTVAIKKVMGAESMSVMKTLIFRFIKLILISFVIGVPTAFFIINRWLQGYSYRISSFLWEIVIACIVTLAISLLSVFWQSRKTAISDPVKSLRKE
mgnify:FL=1